MTHETLFNDLKLSQEFFERSTRVLTEEDSGFRPAEGTWTAAQQVAHVARTIDWFLEGAGRPEGFDMNFQQHMAQAAAVTSLKAARDWLAKSYQSAHQFFAARSESELQKPLPAGPIMGGAPLVTIAGAMIEHTAHHRGALTVYSRRLGKTPLMPYGE